MDALEVLMEEHEIILYAIRVLDESTARLQIGKDVPKKFYDEFSEITRNFADRCHHGKEEAVLFPMVDQRDPSQHETVTLLLADHEKGRSFLAGLNEAVNTNDMNEVTRNSEGYASLLKLHIQNENLLFPNWMSMLSENDKATMYEKFEEIEERVIGKGKHEEYTLRIKNLSSQIQ